MVRIILAGHPTAIELAGIFFVTTACAATIELSPIVTFGKIEAPSPIHTLLPITTGPLEYSSLLLTGICKSLYVVLP
ncbi:hypothetical protein BACFRA24663_09450 [Bacteroides fragilis]